jgi:hypothetical protein
MGFPQPFVERGRSGHKKSGGLFQDRRLHHPVFIILVRTDYTSK